MELEMGIRINNQNVKFSFKLLKLCIFFLAPPAAPPLPPANPPAAPPAPPAAPPIITGIPPPPPPPMPTGNGGDSGPVSGLAAALQAAKLRKTAARTPNENSGGSTTSSAGSSGYGSIGKGKYGIFQVHEIFQVGQPQNFEFCHQNSKTFRITLSSNKPRLSKTG